MNPRVIGEQLPEERTKYARNFYSLDKVGADATWASIMNHFFLQKCLNIT